MYYPSDFPNQVILFTQPPLKYPGNMPFLNVSQTI